VQHTREIPVRLRAISGTDDDARIVQAIYDAAPAYWQLGGNTPGQTDIATETFAILPAGCTPDDKRMYLIEAADRPVGFIDVIRGYPTADTAYVGLFVIVAKQQRAGIGRTAYAALECELAGWDGIERVRLAIFEVNEPALQFWTAMGLSPTGERGDSAHGDVRTECLLFEKRIAAGHDR